MFIVIDFLVYCCSVALFIWSSMHVFGSGGCVVFILLSCGMARIQSTPGTESLPPMVYVDLEEDHTFT
jgi:hypothetical protein